MTATLDEARRWLVAGGLGASGPSTSTTSIFVDSLPEWPGISVVLALGQGLDGVRHFGDAGGPPGIERPRIEVLVRSTAPDGQVPASSASKAVATKVYRRLVSITNQTLAASSSATGTWWLGLDGPPPHLFDRDPQGRLYWRTVLQGEREST